MKKLFNVIFISLFSLLFFMIFLIYREQDISNMHNLFGFTDQYENGDIYFQNPLSEEEQNQVIQKAETIANNEDVTIMFAHYEGSTGETSHFHYYVSGKDNFIQQMVPSSVSIPRDFSKGSTYLTTDLNDSNTESIPFFSFYQEATYSVYPISHLMENPEAMRFGFTYFYEDKEDRSYFENVFSTTFREFNIDHQMVHHEVYNSDQALLENTIYISLIVLALSVTFVLFQISNTLKEVAILKLNGYRLKDILLYLFKENIILAALFAMTIPLALTLISFRSINARVLNFLTQVLSVSFLLVGFYVLIVLLSMFIIRHVRLSDLLKNKNINQLLTHFIYGTLILTSVFVLPIINASVEKLVAVAPYYLEQQYTLKGSGDLYTIQEVNDPKREWEFNQMDYAQGKENNQNEKHIEIYNTLDSMDALYQLSPNVIGGSQWDSDATYLLYQINEKSFEDQVFYVDDEKISVTDRHVINVFMDQATARKEEWQVEQFTQLENVEVTIYLFDQVDYIAYDQEDYRNYDNEHAPIFVYTTHPDAFRPDITAGGLYFDGEKINETKEYLNTMGIGEHLTFRSSKEEQEKLFKDFLYTVRVDLMTFLPGALCLIVLFIAFQKFILLGNQKEWRILKGVGFKTFDLTKPYFMELILLNLLIIAIQYVFLRTVLWGSMSLLVFLSLVSYLLMNRESNKIKIN